MHRTALSLQSEDGIKQKGPNRKKNVALQKSGARLPLLSVVSLQWPKSAGLMIEHRIVCQKKKGTVCKWPSRMLILF